MQSSMMWHNSIDDGGKILIESHVVELIRGYCQHEASRPESGGILLGYRRGNHLHIIEATTPQPNDQCMRFQFLRRDINHQKVATRRWDISGNLMDYVGEWHTHPEAEPTPSSLDMKEWEKICCARQAGMAFLIAGWTGALWLGVGQGKRIVQAEVIIEDAYSGVA